MFTAINSLVTHARKYSPNCKDRISSLFFVAGVFRVLTPLRVAAVKNIQTADVATDPQALLRHAENLTRLNSSFEIAVNNMARGLSMFDAERRLVVCNALYREIYGLTEEITAPGTPFSKIVAFHSEQSGSPVAADDLERQKSWIDEHAHELQNGKIFTHLQHLKNGRIILVTNQPLTDGGWVDTQEDVTEKTLAEARITWLARHCQLTELANRSYLREKLDEMIRALDADEILAVHLVDLDYFKQVNDTLGHAAGDTVLKAVAKRMQSSLREHDFVGRLGGDEFAIIQVGISDPEHANHLAHRLIKTLNTPYRVFGSQAGIGASIGIAICPHHGADTDTLLQRADEALYRVKARGRGSFAMWNKRDAALQGSGSLRPGRHQPSILRSMSQLFHAIAMILQRPFKER
jgi:diguanylate cyclase (GGDEF)-like protein